MTSVTNGAVVDVCLELLGAQIWIRCAHPLCAHGIAEYFRPRVRPPRGTPDLVVECDWELAGKYLFRSRPENGPPVLDGVRIQRFGAESSVPWASYDPPIPALAEPPFLDRFVALHAASVADPLGRCVVIAGQRGTGKTTLALSFVNEHAGALVTDETTFLYRRSRVVEPFPRAIQLWNGDNPKLGRPADEVCRRVAGEPAIVTRLVLLELVRGLERAELACEGRDRVLQRLLPHLLRTGTTLDECMVTLASLVDAVGAITVFHGGYEQLVDRVPALLSELGWPRDLPE